MKARVVALALVLVGLLSGAVLSSDRAAAGDGDVRLVVILLSGWTSSWHGAEKVTDPGSWHGTWGGVTAELGFLSRDHAGQIAVVPYSYAGLPAGLDAGDAPEGFLPYDACRPNQPLTASADNLDAEVGQLEAKYTNAKIVLIGHSEGGAVATYWAGRSGSDVSRVALLATIDSPVSGLTWSKVALPQFVKDSIAGARCDGSRNGFIDEIDLGKRADGVLAGMASAGKKLGGHLVHFANSADVFIRPEVQKTPSGTTFTYDVSHDPDCGPTMTLWAMLKATIAPVEYLLHCAADAHGALLQDPSSIAKLTSLVKDAFNSAHKTPPPPSQPGSGDQYLLPAPGGHTVHVTQGNNAPGGDHNGAQAYAFDFAESPGQGWPVAAARDGTVIGAEGSSQQRCSDKDKDLSGAKVANCWTKANYVLVDHGDGTSDLYMHFAPNTVKVKSGDKVKQGDELGTAGMTGWASGVHLHFQVETTPGSARASAGWWWTASKPVAFSDPDVLMQAPDGVPRDGGCYISGNRAGAKPAPNTACPGTQPTIPNAPSDVTGFGDAGVLGLNWKDNSPDETGFHVYGLVKSCSPDAFRMGDVPANSTSARFGRGAQPVEDEPPQQCQTSGWNLGVSAYNAAGESAIAWAAGPDTALRPGVYKLNAPLERTSICIFCADFEGTVDQITVNSDSTMRVDVSLRNAESSDSQLVCNDDTANEHGVTADGEALTRLSGFCDGQDGKTFNLAPGQSLRDFIVFQLPPNPGRTFHVDWGTFGAADVTLGSPVS